LNCVLPQIAAKCIAAKTDMVTASYLTDPMKALHESAEQAGITVVNEVGLLGGFFKLLSKFYLKI
jgi:alpha-aminoadipic semialdehyde synthase